MAFWAYVLLMFVLGALLIGAVVLAFREALSVKPGDIDDQP